MSAILETLTLTSTPPSHNDNSAHEKKGQRVSISHSSNNLHPAVPTPTSPSRNNIYHPPPSPCPFLLLVSLSLMMGVVMVVLLLLLLVVLLLVVVVVAMLLFQWLLLFV